MEKFTTNGQWTRVKYRGFVIGVSKEQIPDGMWDPRDLLGEVVEIDGEFFLVNGVEMFKTIISPENPYKWDFGLLVREEPIPPTLRSEDA